MKFGENWHHIVRVDSKIVTCKVQFFHHGGYLHSVFLPPSLSLTFYLSFSHILTAKFSRKTKQKTFRKEGKGEKRELKYEFECLNQFSPFFFLLPSPSLLIIMNMCLFETLRLSQFSIFSLALLYLFLPDSFPQTYIDTEKKTK